MELDARRSGAVRQHNCGQVAQAATLFLIFAIGRFASLLPRVDEHRGAK
jgi:hypothetical protein